MNIIYSLGGLFKTIGWMITHPLQAKNAGWGGIGQRIGLESIALETGINFDEVAKNEAGKELTIREIQNFSNTINNQEVQRIFSEKTKNRTDLDTMEIATILRDITRNQKIQQDQLNKTQNAFGNVQITPILSTE